MKKRIVSFILAVLLICTLLPTSVFAAGIVASGTCGAQGDNLAWALDSDGTLTISGTGEMHDYNDFDLDNRTPWVDYNEQIKTVIVRSGVKSIGTYAFFGCGDLTQVDIADTVRSIGNYAFYNCWLLSNVVLRNGITSIGDWAFYYCRVTDITLPASLISIGEGAFSGCNKLEQIIIPNSVTSIGELAFGGCDALNSVNIPASVTHIGDGAFANCSKLSKIDVAENNPNYCADYDALFNKDKTCLLRSKVHQYEIIYQIPDGVTSIGAYAFSGNDALAVIFIPDSVTSLGRYAFANCTNLSSLDIPDSVTSIEGGLFSGCTELTKVTLPDGITSVRHSMFDECSSLSEIIIPDSVTAIEDMAFERCTSLTSINIPRNVKSIGWYTFHGCSSLTDVYYDGTEQEWNQIHFESHNGGIDGATKHFNPYNLGEETYSFRNFTCEGHGHCFGMSMTSSAYYMGILDEGQVGAVNGNVYALSKTDTVKAPICYYQKLQGSKAKAAIVAGGSYFLNKKFDISSDWAEIVNYVKDHSFDDKGTLQVTTISWKSKDNKYGAHAVNFLRYSVVNGQERIYVYDNNIPDRETYLYKGLDGKVYQAPSSTFADGIISIDLRSVEKYFSVVGNYFDSNDRAMQEKYLSHAIYAEKGTISVSGATEYLFIAGDTESEYVVFEIPEGCETATITPHVDNATFTYLDEEYSFGKINDETRGEFKLSDSAEENNASLTIQNEGTYENPFVDVAEDAVYYDAVLWAYYHEPEQITGGYTATEFCPGNPCTRGQVVTFLWRAAGCPEPTGSVDIFKDAADIASPYRKAVAWAVEKGITTGYEDSTFRPNDSVTRAQFVTFLWRYEGRPDSSGSVAGFEDAADIAAPYRDAVAWAVEKGVTTGYGDDTFRPNAICTRWAVVLFMYRDMK